MASIFDGDWRSLIIRNGSPDNDNVFHIVVNPANNQLEPNSTHNGVAISGTVGRGNVFDHILIRETNPRRNYKGILLVNGATMIISGLQNLNPQRLDELDKGGKFSEKEIRKLFDQEQEIWIATKP